VTGSYPLVAGQQFGPSKRAPAESPLPDERGIHHFHRLLDLGRVDWALKF